MLLHQGGAVYQVFFASWLSLDMSPRSLYSNAVPFTPTQVEAIRAGMQPGLTMVGSGHFAMLSMGTCKNDADSNVELKKTSFLVKS